MRLFTIALVLASLSVTSALAQESPLQAASTETPRCGPSGIGAALASDASALSLEAAGRFACWCVADTYWDVAGKSHDERIVRAAGRAAKAYERAAPSAEDIDTMGLVVGQTVTVDLGPDGVCTTVVR